jgi:predicted enzyme related to lactoylglutathione lyase
MAHGIGLLVYPVTDLARAKRLFGQLLGVEPYVDLPYYVGYRVGPQEIGLDPRGHAGGLTGPLAFAEVTDIRAKVRQLVEAGAQTEQDVRDVGGGKLTAVVKDADGNRLGLIQNP